MNKVYGQFLSALPTSEIKKNFNLSSNFNAWLLKQCIKFLGYPDIGGSFRFPKVIARLNPQPAEKILDIGCGRGFYSHYIAGVGSDITGIDDGPFVEIAQNIGKTLKLPTKIERANITKTREYFHDATELFDKIIAIEVLEHLVDDANAFADWCRLLKKNGTMIFSVPLATEGELAKFVPDLINDPYGHKRAGYTLQQLQSLFAQNDMEIMEYEAYADIAANDITIKNAYYYNHNQFLKILLNFPIWKIINSHDTSSASSTKGFHAIIVTLKKI